MQTAKKRDSQYSEFCPTFSGSKISVVWQQGFWEEVSQDPNRSTREVFQKLSLHRDAGRMLGVRHCNRLRRAWGLSYRRGRPPKVEVVQTSPGALIRLVPTLANVGMILFFFWMTAQGIFQRILEVLVETIRVYAEAHPDQSQDPIFVHRPQTLLLRFQALLFAPLLGIRSIADFDQKGPELFQLLGRDYKAGAIYAFLSGLEKVSAGEALIPLLSEHQDPQLGYIDGHLFPYWSRFKMHKGKITMLGRIMSGSHLIALHDERGQALYLEYEPPDKALISVIVEYCQRASEMTGIQLFVIDRGVNSLAIALEFERRGWGLLSMLDANQYRGMESFEYSPLAQENGYPPLFLGAWKDPKKRDSDPRHFVLCQEEETLFVYWGTAPFKAVFPPQQWPLIYRARTDIQENAFKHMIAHGALNINYGLEKKWVPDRHQARRIHSIEKKEANIEKGLQKLENEIKIQDEKIAESNRKGHVKRLKTRKKKKKTLAKMQKKKRTKLKKIREKKEALGEPRERFDRQFGKQIIMTFRTFLLENFLKLFFLKVQPKPSEQKPLGLEAWIQLFLTRSGGLVETNQAFFYWISTQGLAASKKKILLEWVSVFNTLGIKHQGKPVHLNMREGPP